MPSTSFDRSLPSNTEINPKENTKECKVIELRSGLKLKEDNRSKVKENELIEENKENTPHIEKERIDLGDKEVSEKINPLERPPPPFPNRLKAHELDDLAVISGSLEEPGMCCFTVFFSVFEFYCCYLS